MRASRRSPARARASCTAPAMTPTTAASSPPPAAPAGRRRGGRAGARRARPRRPARPPRRASAHRRARRPAVRPARRRNARRGRRARAFGRGPHLARTRRAVLPLWRGRKHASAASSPTSGAASSKGSRRGLPMPLGGSTTAMRRTPRPARSRSVPAVPDRLQRRVGERRSGGSRAELHACCARRSGGCVPSSAWACA